MTHARLKISEQLIKGLLARVDHTCSALNDLLGEDECATNFIIKAQNEAHRFFGAVRARLPRLADEMYGRPEEIDEDRL